MALVLLTAAQANLAIDAIFPVGTRTRTATATNTTTTLTFADVAGIIVGMTVTGAGITSGGLVTSIAANVVTISGTITTLTTSAYVFTLASFGSLHTATPGTTGASEVTGGTYGRQGTTWGAPSSGVEATTNAQNWTLMPSVTVTYFGEFTAVTAGTYLAGGLLTSSLTVPAGATVAAAIGALTVQVQG